MSDCTPNADGTTCTNCGWQWRGKGPFPHRNCTTPKPSVGAGQELKAILRLFGIVPTDRCKCHSMAARMDQHGPQWCLEHVEEIVDVMEEEARNRFLPFVRVVGRLLVRRAVRNARKKLEVLERSRCVHGPMG